MLINFHLCNLRTLHAIAAVLVIIGGSVGSWAESHSPQGNSIARGAGKTIIEGGTGAPGFVPVITTVAFHAERTDGGVTVRSSVSPLLLRSYRGRAVGLSRQMLCMSRYGEDGGGERRHGHANRDGYHYWSGSGNQCAVHVCGP